MFPKVVTYYNQLHEVDEKTPCEDFELSVMIEESSGNSYYQISHIGGMSKVFSCVVTLSVS